MDVQWIPDLERKGRAQPWRGVDMEEHKPSPLWQLRRGQADTETAYFCGSLFV